MNEWLDRMTEFNASIDWKTTHLFDDLSIVLMPPDETRKSWSMMEYLEGKAKEGDSVRLVRVSGTGELDTLLSAFNKRCDPDSATVKHYESFLGPLDDIEFPAQMLELYSFFELVSTAGILARSFIEYFGALDEIKCIKQDGQSDFPQSFWTDGGLLGWTVERDKYDWRLLGKIEVVL